MNITHTVMLSHGYAGGSTKYCDFSLEKYIMYHEEHNYGGCSGFEEITLEYNQNEIARGKIDFDNNYRREVIIYPLKKYEKPLDLISERDKNRDNLCDWIFETLECLKEKMYLKSDDTYIINKKNINLLKKLEEKLKNTQYIVGNSIGDFLFIKDQNNEIFDISIYYKDEYGKRHKINFKDWNHLKLAKEQKTIMENLEEEFNKTYENCINLYEENCFSNKIKKTIKNKILKIKDIL